MQEPNSVEPDSITLECAYCRSPLTASDVRELFCSEKCLKLYQVRHGLVREKNDSFSFSREMDFLQQMIYDYASGSNELKEDDRLSFYENVVERTGKILKWINANSLLYEQRTHQKVLEQKVSHEKMERKLHRLLEKAAELKVENKELRQRVKATSTDTLKMARLILGIKENAGTQTIKQAYRNKAKLVHPDREYGDADLFKAVTEAMVLLVAHKEMDN